MLWWTPWVICALVIFVGVVLQRVVGLGVGLIAGPVMSLVLGPIQGPLLANIAAVSASVLIMADVYRYIDWRRTWPILVTSTLAAIPGAWVVAHVNGAWLQVMLGLMVLVALVTSLRMPPLPESHGRTAPWWIGGVAGFFNTTAGVGSPPIVMYARASHWRQETFSASLQPIFILMGTASVAAKLATGVPVQAAPRLFWVATPALLVVGTLIGRPIADRVSARLARDVALGIAGLGGAVVLVKGVWTLLAR